MEKGKRNKKRRRGFMAENFCNILAAFYERKCCRRQMTRTVIHRTKLFSKV